MSFQCLGSWAGDNGETYMSLLDTQLPQLDEDPRPRYRCAVSSFQIWYFSHVILFLSYSIFEKVSGSNIFASSYFHTWWRSLFFVKDVTNFLNGNFCTRMQPDILTTLKTKTYVYVRHDGKKLWCNSKKITSPKILLKSSV